MRTASSALLVIVALLLAAVAGPSLWIQRNVVDQAGFVALAGPLGENKEFQAGLSAMVAAQSTASLNLPPQLKELAVAVVSSAAQGIYSAPGYGQAWTETLSRSHALTFAAAGNDSIEGDVQLDISPLVAMVAASVSQDLGVTLPTPENIVISVEQQDVARLLPGATMVGGWSGWLVFITVALVVVAVIVARRRSLTVIMAGVGLAVVALLWLLLSGFVETFLAQLTVGPEVAQQIAVELGALARSSWQDGINATFSIAGVVTVGGVVALMVKRRHTT